MHFKRGNHLKPILPGGECMKGFFQHMALVPQGKTDPFHGKPPLGKILKWASLLMQITQIRPNQRCPCLMNAALSSDPKHGGGIQGEHIQHQRRCVLFFWPKQPVVSRGGVQTKSTPRGRGLEMQLYAPLIPQALMPGTGVMFPVTR